MRKVLITLASILAVVGIILLNALTFSSRYAKMIETTVTITSVDDSFMGKKMKEFFAREDLEEKLSHEMEGLPLFPTHPEYHEELASLIVSLGRDASWNRSAAREGTTMADIVSASPFQKRKPFSGKTASGKAFRKGALNPSPTQTNPTSASASSQAGKKDR